MLAYLAAYSPLHNIPDLSEARYPSTMVLTGDHDDRVVPLHSLKVRERERDRERSWTDARLRPPANKFIAELQYQQAVKAMESGKEEVEANPLLARIETRAGHGAGKPTAKVIQQNADVYSFVAACTGTGWVLK